MTDILPFSLVFFTGAGTLLLYLKFFDKKNRITENRPSAMSIESQNAFVDIREGLNAKQSKIICGMEIKIINTILEPMKEDISEIKSDMKKVLKGINGSR